MESKPNNSPLVVIVGETASGKSALAMELARKFDGEIIAADSWTVYKGFDIGTAKPGKKDQARVPHHLLDVANPAEGFSAAIFKRLAMRAIEDISGRGKLPILVGGSGLYVDSVIYDYEFLPAPSAELRQRLNAMSLSELLERASELGLDTAAIDARNKRRVIRLIENNGRQPSKKSLRRNTLILGLRLSSDKLEILIKERVNKMVATGLEREVKSLSNKYGWGVEPMKGIGYREWRDYFNREQTLEHTVDRIINSTNSLVKKQRTWFRRNKSIHWVENQIQAVDLVTTFLNK